MHVKFIPSDFPGREHQLNQAGSISIGGLPKWCGCHRTSVMGLKITPADPEALMWPRTLWCVWFYVSPMKPIKLQMQTQPDPSSKLFRLADTVYTKAVIRAKENGRHPRHAEEKRDRAKNEETELRKRRVDSDSSSAGNKPFFFRSLCSPPSVVISSTCLDQRIGEHK